MARRCSVVVAPVSLCSVARSISLASSPRLATHLSWRERQQRACMQQAVGVRAVRTILRLDDEGDVVHLLRHGDPVNWTVGDAACGSDHRHCASRRGDTTHGDCRAGWQCKSDASSVTL